MSVSWPWVKQGAGSRVLPLFSLSQHPHVHQVSPSLQPRLLYQTLMKAAILLKVLQQDKWGFTLHQIPLPKYIPLPMIHLANVWMSFLPCSSVFSSVLPLGPSFFSFPTHSRQLSLLLGAPPKLLVSSCSYAERCNSATVQPCPSLKSASPWGCLQKDDLCSSNKCLSVVRTLSP